MKKHSYQYFGTFDEGTTFIQNQCGSCRLKKECKINNQLRAAIGNNYPFWNKNFTKWEDDSITCKKLLFNSFGEIK